MPLWRLIGLNVGLYHRSRGHGRSESRFGDDPDIVAKRLSSHWLWLAERNRS